MREPTRSGESPAAVFCPDGVPPCEDCRNGDYLMWSEICDTCGRAAPEQDMSDCPYFARYSGLPGSDPNGTCSYGCRDEPSCITDRPRHGWPSEQKAQHTGSSGEVCENPDHDGWDPHGFSHECEARSA